MFDLIVLTRLSGTICLQGDPSDIRRLFKIVADHESVVMARVFEGEQIRAEYCSKDYPGPAFLKKSEE